MKRGGRQKPIEGDYFVIPLEDGSYGYGQVMALAPLTLENAAVCAFFPCRLDAVPMAALAAETRGDVVSVLWVTRDLLNNGTWRVVGTGAPMDPREHFPDIEGRRAQGFVGTKVYGSGIARKFINAYFGLLPWDDFAEPDYLDKLLLKPEMRPAQVLLAKARSGTA